MSVRPPSASCPGCQHDEALQWQPRQWYSAPGAPDRLGAIGIRHQPAAGVAAIQRGTALGGEFAIQALTCLACGLTRRWAEDPKQIPIGPGVVATWLVTRDGEGGFRGCSDCGGDQAVASHPIDFLCVITGRKQLAVREALLHRVRMDVEAPCLVEHAPLVDHTCYTCGRMTMRVEQLDKLDAQLLAAHDAPQRIHSPCHWCGEADALEAPVMDWVWRFHPRSIPVAFPRPMVRSAIAAIDAPAGRAATLAWVACVKCRNCRLFVRSPELCPIGPEHGVRTVTAHRANPISPYR